MAPTPTQSTRLHPFVKELLKQYLDEPEKVILLNGHAENWLEWLSGSMEDDLAAQSYKIYQGMLGAADKAKYVEKVLLIDRLKDM